jgi:hypothetical protein
MEIRTIGIDPCWRQTILNPIKTLHYSRNH